MECGPFEDGDFLFTVEGVRPKWMKLIDQLTNVSGMEGIDACDFCGRVLELAGWARSSGLCFCLYPNIAAMVFNRVCEVLEVTNDPDRVLEELELRR